MSIRFTIQKPPNVNPHPSTLSLLAAVAVAAPDMLENNNLFELAQKGIKVEVTPYHRKHSREQENYYRKWCREFAKWTGDDPDYMHEMMLRICFGTEVVEGRMGPLVRPVTGSSKLKVNEYSDLIETLIRVAAEQGFVIPPPTW